jgi:hypothetical protein
MFVDVGLELSEKPSMFERIDGIEMDLSDEVGTAFRREDRDVADVELEDDDEDDEDDEEDEEDDCGAEAPPPR